MIWLRPLVHGATASITYGHSPHLHHNMHTHMHMSHVHVHVATGATLLLNACGFGHRWVGQQGQSALLGRAPARLLQLLGARLAALGSSAVP